MSVSSMIAGGIRLIRTRPQVVAIWAALYVIAAALGMMVMRPFMAAMLDAQRQAAANAAMGIKPSPMFAMTGFGNILVFELFIMVLAIIAFAAVVRAVVRPTDDRFAYLRVGMDELRLLGLAVLLTLIAFAAEIVAIIIVALLVGLFALILGKIGAIVVGVILGIALFGAAIYAEVRISLAGAMTVIDGRIVIKDAWRATKGRFWTLFGAYLVMGLAYLVVTAIIIAITNPQTFTAYASFNPQAVQAAAQAKYASGVTLGYVLELILGAVVAVPLAVVFCASIATAAIELGGVPNSVADEFA